MLARFLAAAALLAFLYPARADIVVVRDPDKWIEQALQDITQGKTDDFARNFLTLIDQPNSFDSFAGNLRELTRIGAPAFLDKVYEAKYGDSLREVIYMALYQRSDYIYFKFIIKKNVGGWLISNFAFKNEASGLFPKDFGPAR